jgi:hypothetical protein
MRSVADTLHADTDDCTARLTPGARVRLALALGERDAGVLAAYRGISREEARRVLAAQRRRGRARSASLEGLPP